MQHEPELSTVGPAGVSNPQPARTKDESNSPMAGPRYTNGSNYERPMPQKRDDFGLWIKIATSAAPIIIAIVATLLASGWLIAPAKKTDLDVLTIRFDLWSKQSSATLDRVEDVVAKSAATVIEMDKRLSVLQAQQDPRIIQPQITAASSPPPPSPVKARAKPAPKTSASTGIKFPW